MNFRVTTNMTLNSYRYNLQNSTKKLTEARDMVLTGRYFNSYAEDPAGATLSFRLRRSYLQTCSYLANTKEVYSKFNTGWQNLAGVIEDLSDATARTASIRGNNGATGEARSALAIDLRKTAESLIHSLNQKLGDHFIFAGNDALNAPFSWSEDGKILYYRGVNVNAGGVPEPVKPTEQSKPDWAEGEIYDAAALAADQAIADNIDALKQDLQDAKDALDASDDLDEIESLKEEIEDLENQIKEEEDKLPWWWGKVAGTDRLDKPAEMPLSSKDPFEQAWIDYYNGTNGGLDPSTQKPGWVQNIENGDEKGKEFILDEYGTPDEDAIRAARGGTLRPIDEVWLQYYKDLAAYNKDQEDYEKLQAMSGEEMYIDLGMGAAEKAPNMPVKGTYFNSALCGIDFLNFGVDEDGDPKNLALIMKELADVFDTWDEDTQSYNPDLAKDTAAGLNSDKLEAKAFRLMDKLKAAQEHTTEMWVEMDAQSVYLQSSESRLSLQATQMNIQIVELEEVDPAEAISMFAYQNYCYSAALKIGNQLLSQSLIDYMR